MKKLIVALAALLGAAVSSHAVTDAVQVSSPDGRLTVQVGLESGNPYYTVTFDDVSILEKSPLGLTSTLGEFDSGMTYDSHSAEPVSRMYAQDRIKKSFVKYKANKLTYTMKNAKGNTLSVIFQVSDNNVAFRYELMPTRQTLSAVVLGEATGFDLPHNTTTFLTPQSTPMIGFAQTKPSYEEGYSYDGALGEKSAYGCGYTFPCLFHIGENHWALISETGVSGSYVASHLSDGTADGLYTIAFPDEREMNGWGSTGAAVALPALTPWRTITVGDSLAPIVETTVPFDLVDPLYDASQGYRMGHSTWSWIMWGDGATTYEDQVTYIDFAAAMGYEYCLVDALWDTQIGRDRMEELVSYARSKGVGIFLWYNSNGAWNDAPQGPKGCLSSGIARKAEMKWLQKIGVKGLKVDFFGSDKQPMIQLYEDILSDANEYGLMIIFHGCTLPRGWERMYPNYVGSEAVLASENLMFGQQANDMEATSACMHPFIRNAVGSMEFGGSTLNRRYSRGNNRGTTRRTTDAFELAAAVLFQSPVQNFALAPNNLYDVPEFEMDFMRKVPTTWDDVKFIDGYPGKYCVLARKHGNTWYVVGVNADKSVRKLSLDLSSFNFNKGCHFISDCSDGSTREEYGVNLKNGVLKVEMQPDGGFVAVF